MSVGDGALPKFSYEVLCDNFCNPDICERVENHKSSEELLQQCEQDVKLIGPTPIVANYLWSRLQLLEKHFISNEYSDHDINLKWDPRKWTVEGEGYLFSEEYDVLNKDVAKGGVTEEEQAEEVLKHAATLPTVSLDRNHLCDMYELSEARAQDVVELAGKHQISSNYAEPPSLLTMWTGKGVQASSEEVSLRQRVIQLAQELPEDTLFAHSTLKIARGLSEELKIVSVLDVKLREIDEKIVRINRQMSDEDRKNLGLYHLLLWKTAGREQWTYLRGRSEMGVKPYLPKLLELTRMKMEAQTAVGIGGMQFSIQPPVALAPFLASLVDRPDCWKEVSILEFISSKSLQTIKELKSQVHVDVKARNDTEFGWRPEKATDKDSGEKIFKSFENKSLEEKYYVMTDSDPRKLYEARPEAMQSMKYVQFVCQYRQLNPSYNGYNNLYDQCINNNLNKKVGPDSDFPILGVRGRAAPTGMILNNGILMKLRGDKIAVPLLPNGEMDIVAEILLFGQWQHSEKVTRESVSEGDSSLKKEQRKSIKQEIFPKMILNN